MLSSRSDWRHGPSGNRTAPKAGWVGHGELHPRHRVQGSPKNPAALERCRSTVIDSQGTPQW